jgi:3-hydroxy-3-methylglutaryl CoA synthase
MTRHGIVAYAGYLPAYRLERKAIAAALGLDASGSRTVASYDQDSTTLGVEVALDVVRERAGRPRALWFATTAPVYVDKTNASTVHAALGLPAAIAAFDLGATLRSGAAALLAAAGTDGLAVLADLRGGAVGGADERDGADAAAAFLMGTGDGIVAEVLATASVTAEFLDRWRAPGAREGSTWEERFGETRYLELTHDVLATLGEQFDLATVDRFVVVCANARAVRSAGAVVGMATGAKPADLGALAGIGHAGAAQVGIALVDILDTAGPGETVLVVSLADGADAIVLRTTQELPRARTAPPLREQCDDGIPVDYAQYLVWRNRVVAERPRRPDPERPSAPYAWRDRDYKFALTGARCRVCGAVQYPQPEVCYRCHSRHDFEQVSGAGRPARVVTFTVDRLAFSPSPPLISAVVQFDGGGRINCELTDVREPIAVGERVLPTFRRVATVAGIENYSWKARPIACPES